MKRDYGPISKTDYCSSLKERNTYQGTCVEFMSFPKLKAMTNAELQYHVWLLQEARYIMADGSMGLNELDFTWGNPKFDIARPRFLR